MAALGAWRRMLWLVATWSFVAAALAAPPARVVPKKSEPPFPIAKAIRLLQGKDEERAQGLQLLESQSDPAITAKALLRALDKESRARGQLRPTTIDLIERLGKIDRPEVLETLTKWLQAPNYKFALVVAEVLGKRADPTAIAGLDGTQHEANFREVFGFRKSVVDAVLGMADRRAVEFAIRLLPQSDGIVRYDLLRYLLAVTDQDFGADHALWSTWWQDNQQDFQFAQGAPPYDPTSGGAVPVEGLSGPTFYGVKIYAKRIVFVIDTSSSMVEDGPPPPNSRMDLAKKELTATIGQLPDDAYFTILAFHDLVSHWKKGLQPATQESRDSAAQWVQYLKYGKGTNSHAALTKAFAVDGNIEAIVFLSDGRPSRGVTDVMQILADVARENRTRKLSIYSIGIFTGQGLNQDLAGFMSELARQNRGVYKQVN
jgi:hypothetical protein